MAKSKTTICVLVTIFFCLGLSLIIGIVALAQAFIIVPPGEVGIVVTRGNLRAVGPGRHSTKPFGSKVTMMTTKTQLLEETHAIPTKEGLAIQLGTTVQYYLDGANADTVYRDVGTDYAAEKLIAPAAASIIRTLTSRSEAKASYTNGREEIQKEMTEKLTESLESRGIVIEGVFLKHVTLPAQLQASIDLKVQAEQDSARMEFQLEQERLEAERKAIEAGGIAEFQRIVSEGISDQLLQWKGIEATLELANSENSKIVVMGNSKNDLPFLLNGDHNTSS